MEITPQNDIRRLILKEPGGNQTDFRFADEVANGAVAAEMFRFTPPQGTEIVRQ
jgi:hypothetical protein